MKAPHRSIVRVFLQQVSSCLRHTNQAANNIWTHLRPSDVVALTGPMGAGKTSLIQQWVRLGSQTNEEATSPTFSLIKEYNLLLQNKPVHCYHLDLYRLRTQAEVEQLGVEEFFGSPSTLFLIEWAEPFADYLRPVITKKVDIQLLVPSTKNQPLKRIISAEEWC